MQTDGSTSLGRTGDWLRVDGENMTAGPIERILQRMPEIGQATVYGVPDDSVGVVVLTNMYSTSDQADLSSKGWPRYVRVSSALPTTATNKIIKRELMQEGATARTDEQLWMREPRGKNYRVSI